MDYNSVNAALRQQFGRKIVKLSLDGGFSCPNREGGRPGCLFCGEAGSGEFAGNRQEPIPTQLARQKALLAKKWPGAGYIAYFQAFTNTYAPAAVLEERYRQALSDPEVVGLAIATRPDCLPPPVLDVLEQLNRETFLWVELGFQTATEEIAAAMGRGYPNPVFAQAVQALAARGVRTVAHVIVDLPGETEAGALATIDTVNALPLWGIKLHFLYVTEGTPLAQSFQQGGFSLPSREETLRRILRCTARLRPDLTVHRLTGDGPRDTLLAPLWSRDKRRVLNDLTRLFRETGLFQGCDYRPPAPPL